VLLLDEPSAGLDDASIERLSDLLERVRSRTAVVMSTHDRALVNELTSRTVLADHGRLLDSRAIA
jgi:energy-coupling factor transporter ATP-binding protein EcfA2